MKRSALFGSLVFARVEFQRFGTTYQTAKTGWLIAAFVAHSLIYLNAGTGLPGAAAFYGFYGAIFVVGT